MQLKLTTSKHPSFPLRENDGNKPRPKPLLSRRSAQQVCCKDFFIPRSAGTFSKVLDFVPAQSGMPSGASDFIIRAKRCRPTFRILFYGRKGVIRHFGFHSGGIKMLAKSSDFIFRGTKMLAKSSDSVFRGVKMLSEASDFIFQGIKTLSEVSDSARKCAGTFPKLLTQFWRAQGLFRSSGFRFSGCKNAFRSVGFHFSGYKNAFRSVGFGPEIRRDFSEAFDAVLASAGTFPKLRTPSRQARGLFRSVGFRPGVRGTLSEASDSMDNKNRYNIQYV